MRTLVLLVAILAAASGFCAAQTIHWTQADDMIPQDASDAVAAGDLDGDLDQDLSFVAWDMQYWNAGTPEAPEWELDEALWASMPPCALGKCALGDVDGDGDLDLITGCQDNYESLLLYINVGTGAGQAWEYDPALTWFGGGGPIDPYLVDMDADGDLDLLVARGGIVSYLLNEGTPASPTWSYAETLEGVELSCGRAENAVAAEDIDGDGDCDLMGVASCSQLRCWENVGTPESYVFVENQDMAPQAEIGPDVAPCDVELFDLDADGDQDLLVLTFFGGNYFFLNDGPVTSVQAASWATIKALYR